MQQLFTRTTVISSIGQRPIVYSVQSQWHPPHHGSGVSCHRSSPHRRSADLYLVQSNATCSSYLRPYCSGVLYPKMEQLSALPSLRTRTEHILSRTPPRFYSATSSQAFKHLKRPDPSLCNIKSVWVNCARDKGDSVSVPEK